MLAFIPLAAIQAAAIGIYSANQQKDAGSRRFGEAPPPAPCEYCGTTGHGIDMLPGETPEQAFRRYCDMGHERKGRKFKLRFIGPCGPPPEKVFAKVADDAANCAATP